MALSPEVVKREREKIPQFEVSGTVGTSSFVRENGECIHTYESTLSTESQTTTFEYFVLVDICTTDTIYEIESKPFKKNKDLTLSLTQAEPHFMVTSELNSSTQESQSNTIIYIFGAVVLVVAAVSVIFFLRARASRKK